MKKLWIFGAIVAVIAVVIVGVGLAINQRNNSNSASSSSQSTSTSTSTSSTASSKSKNNGKTIIVYFSRAGENYGNENLKVGYTHQLANLIADKTKATEYEIVPADPYPKSYKATADRAQSEQTNNSRPRIKGQIPDLSQYSTVFIGYPIWWNEPPMIIRTFLASADLSGKRVIPFSTNGGSGWGDSLTILRRDVPHANFARGIQMTSDEVHGSRNRVNSWLTKLGY